MRQTCFYRYFRALDFSQAGKGLAELCHLGASDGYAITLVGVVGKVILVVGFGRPVVGKGQHLGDNGLAKNLVGVQLGNHRFSDLLLLWCGVINATAVLRASVIALAVHRGGVMHDKKYLKNLGQADLCRVVGELDDLVAAGSTGTNIFVTGFADLTVAVT